MTSCFKSALLVGWIASAGILGFQATVSSQAPQQPTPRVKNVAATPIQSLEGADNFAAYCAVCHGNAAKGDGPAAAAMKTKVPDLTRISQRNGKFSATDIEHVIRGTHKTSTPAHGVETMPIWGSVFRAEDDSRTTLRIGNLVKYLQSIQEGPTK
jgi:mono/diheme cytochrome c family protein